MLTLERPGRSFPDTYPGKHPAALLSSDVLALCLFGKGGSSREYATSLSIAIAGETARFTPG